MATTDPAPAPLRTDIPLIETPRLRLRARGPEDAEALFPAMSDPTVMMWWSRAPFETLDELRDYFAVGDGSDPWRAWAITRIGEDRAIGFVAAGEKRGGVSEIGYLLAPEGQGQGLAREAVGGVISRLFVQGQRRLFADTDPENHGSIALLERLGFRREGHLRAEWQTHLGVRDSLIYGLLADEWRG
jgi:RimJ/RimL family protein N-acetyltransferase